MTFSTVDATAGPWARVTRDNPCPVCLHEAWCTVHPAGTWARCMREPSDRPHASEGWLHRIEGAEPLSLDALSTAPSTTRADAETCSRVYTDLLRLLTLEDRHRAQLLDRGLSSDDITRAGYRSLPPPDRRKETMSALVASHWSALVNVPGFRVGDRGRIAIGGAAGIIIPARTEDGSIPALVVRPDEPRGGKYLWLSSSSKGGPGAAAITHVPLRSPDAAPARVIYITEGTLKADVAAALLPTDQTCIGIPGVSAWKQALGMVARIEGRQERAFDRITVAFDEDRPENPAVERARAELARALVREYGPERVRVARWDGDRAKGIDDALRAGVGIEEEEAPAAASAPAGGSSEAPSLRALDRAMLHLVNASDDRNSRDGSGLCRDDARWARDRGNGIGNEESLSEILRRGAPIPHHARRQALDMARRYARTQLEPAGFSWQEIVGQEAASGARFTPVIELAADLMRRDIPPLRYVVEGLFPEGMVILAGRPKQGKSWLALSAALAVAQGARFLGRDTTGGDVLCLFVEDGEKRIQTRIQNVWGPTAPERLHYSTRWPRWHEGGREALEDWLTAHPAASLVVIDTWGRVAPPPSAKRDAYSETTEILGPLQELAQSRHVCVLLVHHSRKTPQGGEVDLSDGILGSTALSGVADTLAVLKRQRGTDSAQLDAAGRDVPDTEMTLGWTDRGWALLTAADTVTRDPVARAVVALVGSGPWEGTATDLLLALSTRAENTDASRGWPPTPTRLSERLGPLVPALASVGIDVAFSRTTKGKRIVSIRSQGDAGPVFVRHPEESSIDAGPGLFEADRVTLGDAPTIYVRHPISSCIDAGLSPKSTLGDAGDARITETAHASKTEQPDEGDITL